MIRPASKPTLGTALEPVCAHQPRYPMTANLLAKSQQLTVQLARTVDAIALQMNLANQQAQFTVTQ